MWTSRRIISTTVFCVLLAARLYAITDEEIFRNFQFSFLNPGARSAGMGNAFVALADDATAAEANPAGLTILTKPEVSFEFRSTSFDADKLNSLNRLRSEKETFQVRSKNDLETVNRPSFFSFVYPTPYVTLAVSRQEAVQLHGTLGEILDIVLVAQDGSPLPLTFTALGTEDQEITNWNFSIARKLPHRISIGATFRYSQLDWKTSVNNTARFVIGEFVFSSDTFQTSMDAQDNAFGLNLGLTYKPLPPLSLGVVYKMNPKFEAVEVETGDEAKKPGPFRNVLNIPDILGLGVSYKPNDVITVNSDVVRIQYSDLMDDFQGGYNQLTDSTNFQSLRYKISDAYEFHVGTEFYLIVKETPVAIRIGYYRKPSNSLEASDVSGLLPFDQPFAKSFFRRVDAENHITIGAGVVVLSDLQIDVAFDAGKSQSHFIVSTVYRF